MPLNKGKETDGTMIFDRYIGIDYSGAEVPTASLKGLRIYEGDRLTPPREVAPPKSPRSYWTRREIAEWLVANLSAGPPSIVGIDHGFSFPIRYFQKHGLPLDWPSFLDDFQQHWPTDDNHMYVDFTGAALAATENSPVHRTGLRACEQRRPSAGSGMQGKTSPGRDG